MSIFDRRAFGRRTFGRALGLLGFVLNPGALILATIPIVHFLLVINKNNPFHDMNGFHCIVKKNNSLFSI